MKQVNAPCVLRNNSNDILLVCTMNKKAASKTVESKILWIVHPKNKKVVCASPEIHVLSLIEREQWYEALAKTKADKTSAGKTSADKRKTSVVAKAARFQNPVVNNKQDPKTEQYSVDYRVLDQLYSLLCKRKKQLPEGSYSTYLFQQGEEKIAKKIGEEAIELILSQKSQDIYSESADLLYHLWVYLVQKNLKPQNIIKLLSKRFSKDGQP